MKLNKTMTEYVLDKKIKEISFGNTGVKCLVLESIDNRANFLSMPLEKWMFVAINKDGKIYKSYHSFNPDTDSDSFICEPYEGLFEIKANEKCSGWKYLDVKQTRYYDAVSYEKAFLEFQQAKQRVIFEGCKSEKKGDWYIITDSNNSNVWVSWNNSKTIEDLIPNNLTITPEAVKKYNL